MKLPKPINAYGGVALMIASITYLFSKNRRKQLKVQLFLGPIKEIIQRDNEWYCLIDEEIKRTNELEQSTFEELLFYLSKQISDLDLYLTEVKSNRFIRDSLIFYRQYIELLNLYKKNFDNLKKDELPNLLYFYGELRTALGIPRG
ncbi:hypothetical protein [Cohnella soli]|uniref:Uncharacterized protein n=1 Tax=Cohnella soli TaxID=425005 RepID=A0ABW0HZR7_9BACL